jgi:2,3,4,5-tetrahydropyridine-2-carboxylate N-succinyltransferase
MQQLQNVIESAFERRADITPANVDTVCLIPARCV